MRVVDGGGNVDGGRIKRAKRWGRVGAWKWIIWESSDCVRFFSRGVGRGGPVSFKY